MVGYPEIAVGPDLPGAQCETHPVNPDQQLSFLESWKVGAEN